MIVYVSVLNHILKRSLRHATWLRLWNLEATRTVLARLSTAVRFSIRASHGSRLSLIQAEQHCHMRRTWPKSFQISPSLSRVFSRTRPGHLPLAQRAPWNVLLSPTRLYTIATEVASETAIARDSTLFQSLAGQSRCTERRGPGRNGQMWRRRSIQHAECRNAYCGGFRSSKESREVVMDDIWRDVWRGKLGREDSSVRNLAFLPEVVI